MKVNGFSNVTLTITNVKLPMNMSLFCCEINLATAMGPAIQCTTVFIYVPPKILNHTSKISVGQGSVTSMYCSASGTPSPKYYWTKNTGAINDHLVNTSMLTLKITGRESSGNYCCVADNTYARDTKCTCVHVTENKYGQGPNKTQSIPILSVPKLLNTTPQFYVMTDGPVNIKCQETGLPAPKIRWLNASYHVIGTCSCDGSYEVPFQRRNNVNLTFYCVAYNNVANSTKRRLTVYVRKPHLVSRSNSTTSAANPYSSSRSRVLVIILGGLLAFSLVVNFIFISYVIWRQRFTIDRKEKQAARPNNNQERLHKNVAFQNQEPRNTAQNIEGQYEEIPLENQPAFIDQRSSSVEQNIQSAISQEQHQPLSPENQPIQNNITQTLTSFEQNPSSVTNQGHNQPIPPVYQSLQSRTDTYKPYSLLSLNTKLPPKPAVLTSSGPYEELQETSHPYQSFDRSNEM